MSTYIYFREQIATLQDDKGKLSSSKQCNLDRQMIIGKIYCEDRINGKWSIAVHEFCIKLTTRNEVTCQLINYER